ncbi:MAG: MarR family transcriptional regulator [Rhodospirillales bacterium 69-11]|nr:MAG: MarR family transcriptional regulator [Rhodospirillales bacterium 69-11]
MTASAHTVETLREAARDLVREFGFMRGSLAGTDLPPSAVHALIEIEAREGVTATALVERLRLEKSSVSRMLRKLVLSGDVAEQPSAEDGRSKSLRLTPRGRQRVAGIHDFARAQVRAALERLPEDRHRTVVDGLRLYADALAMPARVAPRPVRIERGYRTGLIARVTQLHAHHYAAAAGFGQAFESIVAAGLAAFCNRLDHPGNAIWSALEDETVLGSVTIDGQDLGPDIAHLRWFIVADGQRGRGIGRRLLSAAIAFAAAQGFPEIHLWTFAGLDAARHLYEAAGFACVEERPGAQWGATVREQRFVKSLR